MNKSEQSFKKFFAVTYFCMYLAAVVAAEHFVISLVSAVPPALPVLFVPVAAVALHICMIVYGLRRGWVKDENRPQVKP